MTTPNITVTVDYAGGTYEFTTDPYVKPPDEALPVARLGDFTIKAGGSNSNITVVATLPSTATETTPFDPTMQPVTTTTETYQLTAIGMVTLTVPTYGGRSLTGDPLTLAPAVSLELSSSNPGTALISFGAQVTLTVQGATGTTAVYYGDPDLFVGQTSPLQVEQGGSTFTIGDVDENAYELSTEQSASAKLIPLVGTINVSSTKKPKL